MPEISEPDEYWGQDPDGPLMPGFIHTATGGLPRRKHEHCFRPLQEPNNFYRKRGTEDLFYATLFCECGATKEIVAEDRRTPTEEGDTN